MKEEDKDQTANIAGEDTDENMFPEHMIVEFPSDRTINTTDTNEYATDMRDETLWDRDLIDTEIPLSEDIPDGVNECGWEDRPLYAENGFRNERE